MQFCKFDLTNLQNSLRLLNIKPFYSTFLGEECTRYFKNSENGNFYLSQLFENSLGVVPVLALKAL